MAISSSVSEITNKIGKGGICPLMYTEHSIEILLVGKPQYDRIHITTGQSGSKQGQAILSLTSTCNLISNCPVVNMDSNDSVACA